MIITSVISCGIKNIMYNAVNIIFNNTPVPSYFSYNLIPRKISIESNIADTASTKRKIIVATMYPDTPKCGIIHLPQTSFDLGVPFG